MVAIMCARGWGVSGEALKWRRRLFVWEEELLGECIIRLSNFSFQVDRVDKWIWKLHATNYYTVSSAYCFLTELEHDRHQQLNNNNFLWLKVVPLKVLIFAWRLFLDRIPTRDKSLLLVGLVYQQFYIVSFSTTNISLVAFGVFQRRQRSPCTLCGYQLFGQFGKKETIEFFKEKRITYLR